MIFSRRFRLLAQEGQLATTSILSGLERVADIDHQQPGLIYSALFNLSIGLERTMKLIVVVDHMAHNKLIAPSNSQLRSYGHRLTGLYDHCRSLGESRGTDSGWFQSGDLAYSLLSLISDFAVSSRYHNLDSIDQSVGRDDPLITFFEIHMSLAEQVLTGSKVRKINEDALAYCDANRLYGFTMGMNGEYRLIVDVMLQSEMLSRTKGHLVWLILELIRPLLKIISSVCDDAHRLEAELALHDPVVPHLDEYFPYRYTTRRDAIRRKRWTELFDMSGRF